VVLCFSRKLLKCIPVCLNFGYLSRHNSGHFDSLGGSKSGSLGLCKVTLIVVNFDRELKTFLFARAYLSELPLRTFA